MSVHREVLVVMVALAACVLCASCADNDDWQPPRVVRLEGALRSYSISPMYGVMFGAIVDQDDEEPNGLYRREWSSFVLVRPGDLVALSKGPPLPYMAGDDVNVAVNAAEHRILLQGRTASLQLGANSEEALAWLNKALPDALADIRLVSLAEPADDADALAEQRKALERLCAVKRDVGILVNDQASLTLALELFDPPWLSLGSLDLTEDEQTALAAQPGLHTLFLEGDQPHGLAFLKRLPTLRTLILTNWAGPAEDQPPETLPTLKNLRTLIVVGGKLPDLAPIGNQPALEEVVIFGAERLADLSGLTRLRGLRAFGLPACQEVTDLGPLRSLKHLRWVTLPPATTQEQFATVCADHPNLVSLLAVPCEKITDLTPVTRLRKLQALCVTTTAPLDPLAKVKSLRLLGLHAPEGQEAAARAETEKALVAVMKARPGLQVVEAAPLCVGSGWILLLAPAAAGGWLLARRHRRAGREAPRHA